MRIDRLLAIVIMFLSRRKVTAQQVAERFDISVRTAYRDIEALNSAGIPIVSCQGSGGGYSLMENYKIDRQLFTLDDMLSIIAAFKGINATFSHKHFELLIEKIDSLISPENKHRLSKRSEPLVFDMSPWGPQDNQLNRCMQELYEAIIKNLLVEFSYYPPFKPVSQRTVEPLTILCKSFSWYLFAFCRLRNEYRIFKLKRIRGFNVLKEHFSPRDVSCKEVLINDQKNAQEVSLLLRFSPSKRLLVEEYFPARLIETQHDGSLLVCAAMPEDEWLYGMILSFGPDVEVIEPCHIRSVIATKAANIKKIYQT
ncbi:YafY family protein [Chitinispirillales bacterium ANBcel5]|uniref:helix-turn-helix transcriptional regulator n=1 Tax=Cellulosispirillum alkaliphilum TaxID=3039283 RepID=UPI002A548A8C|nr:YafY family protein [Chitinispirillales bacterium ANBcel5]